MALETRRQPVDPGLQRVLLLGAVARPQRHVLGAGLLLVHGSEQVLQPFVAPRLIALEVEEDVTRRGCRYSAETAIMRRLQQLVERTLQPVAAHLQIRL